MNQERGAVAESGAGSGERYPTAQCSEPAWVNVPTVVRRGVMPYGFVGFGAVPMWASESRIA